MVAGISFPAPGPQDTVTKSPPMNHADVGSHSPGPFFAAGPCSEVIGRDKRWQMHEARYCKARGQEVAVISSTAALGAGGHREMPVPSMCLFRGQRTEPLLPGYTGKSLFQGARWGLETPMLLEGKEKGTKAFGEKER